MERTNSFEHGLIGSKYHGEDRVVWFDLILPRSFAWSVVSSVGCQSGGILINVHDLFWSIVVGWVGVKEGLVAAICVINLLLVAIITTGVVRLL